MLSLLAFSISITLWALWNIVLCYVYATKEALAYNVRDGFIHDFGRLLEWWATGLVIVIVFVVFEVVITSVRRTLWPTDTDVFQELEQEPAMKRRFEEESADVLGQAGSMGWWGDDERQDDKEEEEEMRREEEERRREDEVRDLLQKRETQETTKGKVRRGSEALSAKFRGSVDAMSLKARMPIGGRRRSELDVEMTVLVEEGVRKA